MIVPKFVKISLGLLLAVAVIGAVSAAIFFYLRYEKIKKNPELISKEEVSSVTKIIEKFMDLPTDEEPTLATVTDQEKIKDQEFFKKAQNGDKILLYQLARKAILFRPSTGRIIEFAPLAIGANTQTSQEAKPSTELVSISIYNGSTTTGLTAEVESKLQTLTGVKIAEKENAQKKDYTQTIVIDLSGKNEALATQIAELLGGKVGSLPAEEKKPNSEILIIATK